MKKNLLRILKPTLMAVLFLIGVNGWGQTTIYSEDFSGQNGKGAVGPGGSSPTIDLSGVNWTLDVSSADLSATDDWFKVVSEKFEARDVDGNAIWLSPSIDISSYTNVGITIDVSKSGTMESSDFIKCEYNTGSGWTQFATNGNKTGEFSSAIASQTGLSGATLQIRVTCYNGAAAEYHRFDNILVTGTASCSGQPTAQATNIAFSGQTSSTIDVSWTAGTGGDNYILVVKEGSNVSWTPTDGTDYSAQTGGGDFSAATDQSSGNKVVYSGSGTSTTVTGLTASTTYYFQVFHFCSNASNNYLTSSGTGNTGAQNTSTTAVTYCISNGNGTDTYQAVVRNVTFGSINVSSLKQDNAYTDNTASSTDLIQGGTENLSVSLCTDGGYTYHCLVWIDWNQDGDFVDAGEQFDLGTVYNSYLATTTLSPLTVNIPAGASLGSTRMRVSMKYSYDPTSCETGFDGEVEDYTVNIISFTPDPEPTNHASSFAADAGSTTYEAITLTWTDATGAQVPDGYLIKGSTTSYAAISDPVDGTEEIDNMSGLVLNVSHGTETVQFTGLTSSTDYYFKIYPYSNSGSNINFKTDGTVPTATETTDAPPAVPDLVISEVADPGDNYEARYVEIYNGSPNTVDLSSYYIRRYANGQITSSDVQLSGTVTSGGIFVIAYNQTAFNAAFSFNPDQVSGFINGNGDDVYELYDGSQVIDVFGEVGVDGTGQPWEYEDSRAARLSDNSKSNMKGNTTFTISEWSISSADISDCTPGALEAGQDGNTTLPINLLSFTAQQQTSGVELQWVTNAEINNDYFTVERAQDGINFNEVGRVAGAGNSNVELHYSLMDMEGFQNTIYYRLRQTDYDGTSTLSKVIMLNAHSQHQELTNLYVNNKTLHMQVQSNQAIASSIEVYAVDGRLVHSEALTLNKGVGTYQLTLPNNLSGVYLVNLRNSQGLITKRVLVK